MCGIVGLLVKTPSMRGQLGELMLPMLIGMSERGPESAGLAVFGDAVAGSHRKYSVYSGTDTSGWGDFTAAAQRDLGPGTSVAVHANHAVLETGADPMVVKGWLTSHFPQYHLLSVGRSIDLYKDTGTPAEVAQRYDFSQLQGSHLVGHTRMATETAVTPARAHPFTAGEDFCLVHNGSLSNPNSVRRKLEPLGIVFETDNDTEAACRFLEWRMREGDALETALEKGFDELDGFYTFLMGTRDELALVRDAFSCKPAIVAETDDYVAISSEFRSLAKLPGVKHANIFEPNPEQIYMADVTFDLATTPLRELNHYLHHEVNGAGLHLRVTNPDGAHSIAVGVNAPIDIDIEGHAGYYAAGMNQQARVTVHGNAGPAVAENMMSGRVHVKGFASVAAGASGHGGLLVIDGDASLRCGISMKGIDIVVAGSVGDFSAFMAQAGTLVICGDAGDALGDSLYEAVIYVRGKVKSLGADAHEEPMTDADRAAVKALLSAAGLAHDPGEFRRVASMRSLYHWNADANQEY